MAPASEVLNNTMTYEEKMRLLAQVKPEKKDELLYRIWKGERKVNIQGDEDLFYQINVDRIPMEDLVNKRVDKYAPIAEHAKNSRDIMRNGQRLHYKGEIPLNLWLTHPWFSPNLDKRERDANIERFFKMFPKFKGE